MPFPQYNSPLRFPQESGIVESLQNDLTLRASTSGDVLVSALNNFHSALRPDTDTQQDLGRTDLRWRNLHVSGINNIPIAQFVSIDTQTTINGLSGAVSLTSPDGSILVGDSPQTLEISGLFTSTSGALVQQHSADLLSLSGLILPDGGQTSINDESGVISLLGGDGITVVTTTEGSPGVPAEITISALFTAASGAVLQQKCEDIASVSGTVAGLSEKVALDFKVASGISFVMFHGLNTENFTWNMWQKDDAGINIQNYVLPQLLRPSGVNHVEIGLSKTMVGTLILIG